MPAPPLLINRAREQRRSMADCERRLWTALRSRRFLGYKFRRQVPVGPFIADFACKSRRLIIEVDGDSHGNDQQESRDAWRTKWLQGQGWQVIRFWAHELARMDDVTERIFEVLEGPHPNPLPQAGEGMPSA